MGSTRGKRSAAAQSAGASQASNKRQRTTPNEDGAAFDADLLCDVLPPELLLLVVGNLSPRECQPLRLTCKTLRDLVNTAGAETLTVTNDIAQHLLLEQAKHCRTASHVLSSGWVARLLAKFPRIKKLDVKCSQSVLTMFARHMVRDCLGSSPPGAVPLSRIFDLAENVKTNSRRHSAVLLCELIKFRVAQSLTSKPPGYDAMRQDVKQYVRADQLLAEHRIELQTRVVELVEKVLTLKGHAEARAHENFKYARDTLDDSLLQLVSCLQPRHSKYAYQLLAKAADPAKAARGWRWLFYFLARQKQAEAAIEAYKVVDKQALAQLSPTCLSELFRSLIDNEITTQPEPKLRAITSESGSWTKFLYRGNFTLTSTQSREGALEKVAADLIGRDYLDTAVNVMNRFESEGTAMDIWVQLLGALGIVPGGEMPLVSRELHRSVTEQVTKAAALAMQAAPVRRVACHVPLVEVLVAEGHLDEAFAMVANYPEQGALDKHLLRALSNVLGLAECPPAHVSSATCTLLLDVLQNRLRDVAARSELTTILVAAHAARKELSKAVELASSLDDAAAAAMEADAGAAGGPAVEPVPAAAAAGPVAPGAPGPAGAGADAGAGAGGEAGAEAGGAGQPEQRLAAMWRGVASAAIRLGDAGVLLTALPRVNTSWLMGPAETGHITAAGAGAGAGGAAANGDVEDAVPMDVSWPAEPLAALRGAAASASAGPCGGLAAVPSTVWQRVCGVLLRAGRRPDLESALMQLLAERRRGLGGHTDQRALLESTARAMILNGCAAEALTLARRLGGGYPSAGCAGSASASASPVRGGHSAAASYDASGVRPCWSMLNVLLEGLLASGAVDTAVQELLAAGTAESKAAAAATTPAGPAAAGSSLGSGAGLAALVMPAAAGRLRQSLLADVITALVDSGRPADAVHLLRVLRGSENDGPLLPPPVPMPLAMPLLPSAAAQRPGPGGPGRAGRVVRAGHPLRAGGAAAKRNRSVALASDEGVDPELSAALASMMDADGGGGGGQQAAARAAAPAALPYSTEQGQGPQPHYSRLLLEGSSEEEAGQAPPPSAQPPASAGPPGSARAPPGAVPGQASARPHSLEAALTALVKALQKRSGGGSATASGSSAGGATSGGAGGQLGGGGTSVDLLSDWLEVCKAWPLGPSRDNQLDLLARRALDKGRDLDVALQAGWLLGEASPQDLRFAYTHRDLAQKCISQGMLEAAQSCLLRVKPTNWEDAGDSTARELMRAVARTGDKTTAMQLAASWLANDEHRFEFIRTLRAIRPTAAGGPAPGVGSRAGSSSRGSSRE